MRAALCTDAETARGARRWNDANVLALGLRLTSPEVATEMVDAFLSTEPDDGRAGADRQARLALLAACRRSSCSRRSDPTVRRPLRENPERIKAVNAEVEAMGVKVLQQYALLGHYDFLNILEAPDEKTMARVAITLGARGTLKTLTLTAIPIDEFIAASGESAEALSTTTGPGFCLSGAHVVVAEHRSGSTAPSDSRRTR